LMQARDVLTAGGHDVIFGEAEVMLPSPPAP